MKSSLSEGTFSSALCFLEEGGSLACGDAGEWGRPRRRRKKMREGEKGAERKEGR